MLILGTADAGKSTLIRHMRQLHGVKFECIEMANFKKIIRMSCLEYLVAIVDNFLKNELSTKVYHGACENFLNHYKSASNPDTELIEKALSIWKVAALKSYIQSTINFKHFDSNVTPSSHPGLESATISGNVNKTLPSTSIDGQQLHSDNPMSHFLKCFDRIMAQDYQPSLDDILNLRMPTSGRHRT